MANGVAARLSPASPIGQLIVVLAGTAGVLLIVAIGLWLGTRPASAPRDAGHLPGVTRHAVRLRDALGRRTHPAMAAVVALAAGLAATVIIAYAFGRLTRVGIVVHLDRPVDRYVDQHRIAFVSRQMLAVTLTGSYPVVYGLAVAGGIIIEALSRRWLPLLMLVAAVLTERAMQSLLIRLIHGPRPAAAVAIGPPGGYFSGGSARTVIVCGLLAYFLGWAAIGRRQRIMIWTCVALAAFAEGYSRLYLGRHFAVDILGGWLAGACIAASFAFAAHALRPGTSPRLQDKPAADQPAVPGERLAADGLVRGGG